MKKIFVCLLAVAALASCQKNQVLDTVVGPAIAFENAFVDNATKAAQDPSYDNKNLFDAFYVWGYMDEVTGYTFTEEKVTANGAKWTYANTQYWIADHTYNFEAVAATDYTAATVNVPEGTGKIESIDFVNANGSNDLLYATKAESTTGKDLSAMPAVAFTFNHLLSKVKFTFANAFTNENSTIVVTDIQMTAPNSGNVAVDTKVWTNLTGETTLAFGDVQEGAKITTKTPLEGDNERLTIPASAEQSYAVTFTAKLYNGEVLAMTSNLSAVVEGVAFEPGKAYNLKATLNEDNISENGEGLYPIVFTVEFITDWETPYVDKDATVVRKITNETVAADQTLKLGSDAVVEGKLVVNGTLDGNDNTLFVDAEPTNNGIVCPSGDATIQNVTISGENQATVDGKGTRGIYITSAGTYLIENVTIEGTAYALNVNTKQAVNLTIKNSTFQGWSSYGGSTTATLEGVEFTIGSYYTENTYSDNDNGLLRPYGTSVLTNCSFEDGFVIDLGSLTGTIKFVNCTYAGAALTAANLTGAEGKDVTIE